MSLINIRQLNVKLEKQAEQMSHRLAQKLAHDVYNRSQAIVPVDTGELYDSARCIMVTPTHYKVVYNCPHAIHAHEQPQSVRKSGLSQFLRIAVDDVNDDIISKVSNSSSNNEL